MSKLYLLFIIITVIYVLYLFHVLFYVLSLIWAALCTNMSHRLLCLHLVVLWSLCTCHTTTTCHHGNMLLLPWQQRNWTHFIFFHFAFNLFFRRETETLTQVETKTLNVLKSKWSLVDEGGPGCGPGCGPQKLDHTSDLDCFNISESLPDWTSSSLPLAGRMSPTLFVLKTPTWGEKKQIQQVWTGLNQILKVYTCKQV